jgi:hypothetical protein
MPILLLGHGNIIHNEQPISSTHLLGAEAYNAGSSRSVLYILRTMLVSQ